MLIWLAWLGLFYSTWAALNFIGGLWPQTREHWPIALAMAFGSYVAGATPMGGGTIGFPVLVLLFDQPAALGRNFALMVQSIGMTSASIFILCSRQPIERRMLGYTILGAPVGLLAGTFLAVPYLSDAFVKLVFGCLWASFGGLTLLKNRELCSLTGTPSIPLSDARRLGLLVGVAGGVTAALTGVGIDMMLYIVLVLLFRVDLKIAVPTSVIIMAVTSILGTALHVGIGDITREGFYDWLAAAPMVILGAPLGAFFVAIIPRLQTLYFVAALCILQFFWTIYEVRPNTSQWAFVAVNLAVASVAFTLLYRAGTRLPAERDEPSDEAYAGAIAAVAPSSRRSFVPAD